MFFSTARLSLTAAALVLPIYVQAVAFTVDSFKDIAVGKAKNLTWSGDGNPVTIKLMQGDPKDLETVVNLASNVAGDHYTWTPTTLAAGTYVLSITQGSETNYSPQFSLTNNPPSGGGAPPPHPPIRADTKPPTAATAALALPGTTHPATPAPPQTAAPPPKATAALALPPPGATHPPPLPVLTSAVPIAAYLHPPDGYNGTPPICELTTWDDGAVHGFCYAASATSGGPHYSVNAAASGGQKRTAAVVGAGVVGLGVAVMVVL